MRMFVIPSVLTIVAACTYSMSSGQVAPGATPSTYRYVVLSSATAQPEEVARLLVERGFAVLTRDGAADLTGRQVPEGSVLLLSCTYLGHTASDAMGSTGANVSCEAVDIATRRQVYTGQGKHTGMTETGDVNGAIRNALRDLPGTGRTGSVSMVADLPRRAEPSVPERPASGGDSNLRIVATGTAFFVDSVGHAVTNAHVVEGCARVTIHNDAAVVQGIDHENDLAVIRIASRSQPLPLRSARPVRSGDEVVALGFPLQSILSPEMNVTSGIVSAMSGLGGDSRYLQMTAPIQPGNSGGPLLDVNGRVVGVVVAKLDALRVMRETGDVPQNVNFALSVGALRTFLDARGIEHSISAVEVARSVADIGAGARASVVRIECWKIE